MKITIICAVFPPEPNPAGTMAHQLATRLVQGGHTLTIIVPFPNRPEGIVYPGYRRRLTSRTVSQEGYTVVRCASWLIGARRRPLDRILENITFGLSSMWASLREGRPDLMVLETWPLFAMSFSWLLARRWRVPYLYYVQDVYPEAVEEAGMLRAGGWLSRLLRAWDRKLCRDSATVITISEEMRDLLVANRGLAPDRFAVLPNWADETLFPKWDGQRTWRASRGLPDDAFVALFAGTLGHVSGADVLIDVAELLRGDPGIQLLVIGEGVLKASMLKEVASRGLTNLHLLPFQPAECIPEVQASCGATLLTMQPRASNTSVPSKLISYLAAARPVVCAARSDSTVARTVLNANAGIVVAPGDAQAIAQAIRTLRSDPSTAGNMGQNARQYFEEHLTLDRAFAAFSAMLPGSAEPARIPGLSDSVTTLPTAP